MATSARTGVLSAAAGLTRAAAWAPDWRGAFSSALAREVEERRFFLWIPVAAMGGVALNLAADREPVLWLPALMIAVFARARVVFSRPAARSRALARHRGAVRRFPIDVAAHSARRRAGARPHPHRLAARLCRGSGLEARRRAHGDRRRQRRRHAARESSAPRQGDDAQDARRRGGRFRRAQGAPAAALARGAAGRIRFRPRRVLRRRRRGRLDARPDPASAAAGRRELAPALQRRRSIRRATAWRSGSTRSSAATRARSRRRW